MTDSTGGPTVTHERDREARADLAAAHQMAVHDGLAEGTWNHFSLMLDERRMLITPANRHWRLIDADALVTADLDDADAARARGLQFLIGYALHAAVHRARPDAACVLHVHPPYATALSVLDDDELLVTSQASVEFHGRVAYNERYDLIGGSAGQGQRIADALGDKDVLFLRGHGVLVVGPTIHQAYQDLYLLELACRTQLLAMSTGRPLRTFEARDADLLAHVDDGGEDARRHFDAMAELIETEQKVTA
jgi:ribulose-5-phosphate 4-epimerase/fuculose-1-phosphate aldolase